MDCDLKLLDAWNVGVSIAGLNKSDSGLKFKTIYVVLFMKTGHSDLVL